MIASGLRVFDISNVRRPVEAAYFNKPMAPGTKPTNPEAQGGYAMSQPAWDVERRQVWFTDGNSGFYVVGLTNGRAPSRWLRSARSARLETQALIGRSSPESNDGIGAFHAGAARGEGC